MATKGDNMSINLVGEKVKKLLEDNNLSIVGMIFDSREEPDKGSKNLIIIQHSSASDAFSVIYGLIKSLSDEIPNNILIFYITTLLKLVNKIKEDCLENISTEDSGDVKH